MHPSKKRHPIDTPPLLSSKCSHHHQFRPHKNHTIFYHMVCCHQPTSYHVNPLFFKKLEAWHTIVTRLLILLCAALCRETPHRSISSHFLAECHPDGPPCCVRCSCCCLQFEFEREFPVLTGLPCFSQNSVLRDRLPIFNRIFSFLKTDPQTRGYLANLKGFGLLEYDPLYLRFKGKTRRLLAG